MELTQICCINCSSREITDHSVYKTSFNGIRTLYRCKDCGTIFSETKNTFLEGLRKPICLIVSVFEARNEGTGFNATCRIFKISKNTLLNWEQRFSKLKDVLLTFALAHTFLKLMIEGDELYTKVGKNVPVENCEGWTIVLMDRASRFLWTLECGQKDKELFLKVIQILKEVIDQTGDVTLLTDGERRYGNILFEICHEVVRSGKRGRPSKILPKGVKVRLKNKGSQNKNKGRKRAKYEAPHGEHPETCQDINEKDIHANHVEALNASIRRRNSAYRRRTNTYGKKRTALQRTLDIYWVAHNFIRIHFTTKRVPAVALGILDKGFSWEEIFMVRRIA